MNQPRFAAASLAGVETDQQPVEFSIQVGLHMEVTCA